MVPRPDAVFPKPKPVIQRWEPHEGHRFTMPYTRRSRKDDSVIRARKSGSGQFQDADGVH